MKKFIVPLFLIVCYTALAANPPATAPSALTVEQAQKALADRLRDVDAAKAACQKRLYSDKAYHDLWLDVQQKEDVLEQARDHGTTQEKLDAGSAYNIARLKLEAISKKAIASDPGVIACQKQEDVAKQQLANLIAIEAAAAQKIADAEQKARDQKIQDDADPVAKAIRDIIEANAKAAIAD